MPNSKTLVQAILAAFCAILCAHLCMGGGGMNRRRILAAIGGGWKNPYVTDGLIAMWDGLNNQGPGIQVQNPSTWIDVVGGKVWTPCEGMTFETDHWDNNWFDDGRSVFDVQFPSTADDITIETVFALYDADSQNKFPARIYFSNGTVLNWIISNYSVHSFYGSNARAYLEQSVATHLAITPSEIFKNGVSAWSGLTSDRAVSNISWPAHGATNRHHSAMWALRCYNRTLSASEIAANYAIDKARFNLPDAA